MFLVRYLVAKLPVKPAESLRELLTLAVMASFVGEF